MPQQNSKLKILLIILDGWGYSSKYHGNAIKQAYTPILDMLWHTCSKTLLHASENYVGLPKQQVGNSEVGHTTIGGGRTIDQALVRIGKSIEEGTFFSNSIIHGIYKKAEENSRKVHLVGLCSDGGVHSHIEHLIALIKISKQYNNVDTCIHAITDGRDTKPESAIKFIELIINNIHGNYNIKICTISGRYYSMDRDCRWQRTMKAYECMTSDKAWTQDSKEDNIYNVINNSYKRGIYDEFIYPTRLNKGSVESKDGIICFNFRPDRTRQLAQALCSHTFDGFKRKKIPGIYMAGFANYDSQLQMSNIFQSIISENFLGEIISEKGFKQFRIAETEKYAHVTYFFNGGREAPFPGEDRELIASPQVEKYELTPEMSANQITKKLIETIKGGMYQLLVANYANTDMIGHTGKLEATKKSAEIVDNCIAELLSSIKDTNIKVVITADHGNGDAMLDHKNNPVKSHTKNLVPCIIVDLLDFSIKKCKNDKNKTKNHGSLADIAPTILDLLGVNKPKDMSGCSLLQDKVQEVIRNC